MTGFFGKLQQVDFYQHYFDEGVKIVCAHLHCCYSAFVASHSSSSGNSTQHIATVFTCFHHFSKKLVITEGNREGAERATEILLCAFSAFSQRLSAGKKIFNKNLFKFCKGTSKMHNRITER